MSAAMAGMSDGLASELVLLGPKGIRATRCLETARWCVENGEDQGEIGRGVAACVRSAIELVLDIEASLEESGTWAEGVLEAKGRLDRAVDQGDSDQAKMALGELLATIDSPRQGDGQSKWESKAVGPQRPNPRPTGRSPMQPRFSFRSRQRSHMGTDEDRTQGTRMAGQCGSGRNGPILRTSAKRAHQARPDLETRRSPNAADR